MLTDMFAIKPCPFCGGQPEYDGEYGGAQVTCPKCKCDGPWRKDQNYAEAIRTWNQRVEPSRSPGVPSKAHEWDGAS